RDVHLVWSDPLGENIRQIDTNYLDIRNLNWSPDGSLLTFIGVKRDGEFTVEMLDIETGQRQTLIDELTHVIYPRYADQDTFYTLGWRKSSGEQGFSGFNRDGSPAFTVIVPGEVAWASELFISPDRTLAAIKVRTPPDIFPRKEALHLIPTDGSSGFAARS